MKIKTSELIGPALDWTVAKGNAIGNDWTICAASYHPSTDWSQGGPIIERESIDIMKVGITQWRADCGPAVTGPTPLIASMRAFVTKKFGIEIEIPEELS